MERIVSASDCAGFPGTEHSAPPVAGTVARHQTVPEPARSLELLIGAHENSEWFDGGLVIAGNRGQIHFLQAAFYAVKLECQRRIKRLRRSE